MVSIPFDAQVAMSIKGLAFDAILPFEHLHSINIVLVLARQRAVLECSGRSMPTR